MVEQQHTERVPSTTFGWKRVKISPAPNGQVKQPAAGRRWRLLPPVRARSGLTLRVVLRGGAEGWVEVHARGSMGRFTGDTAIYDVLMEIAEGHAWWAGSGLGDRTPSFIPPGGTISTELPAPRRPV